MVATTGTESIDREPAVIVDASNVAWSPPSCRSCSPEGRTARARLRVPALIAVPSRRAPERRRAQCAFHPQECAGRVPRGECTPSSEILSLNPTRTELPRSISLWRTLGSTASSARACGARAISKTNCVPRIRCGILGDFAGLACAAHRMKHPSRWLVRRAPNDQRSAFTRYPRMP